MTYLIDTHVFIWAASEPELLSDRAREILLDRHNILMFSAASLWETLLKAGKRKLPFFQEGAPADQVEYCVHQFGLIPLPITYTHVNRAFTLPPYHWDPFDRLIVAQALVEGLPLITSDQALQAYPIRTIW